MANADRDIGRCACWQLLALEHRHWRRAETPAATQALKAATRGTLRLSTETTLGSQWMGRCTDECSKDSDPLLTHRQRSSVFADPSWERGPPTCALCAALRRPPHKTAEPVTRQVTDAVASQVTSTQQQKLLPPLKRALSVESVATQPPNAIRPGRGKPGADLSRKYAVCSQCRVVVVTRDP